MKTKKWMAGLALACLLTPARADEGMWLLPFLKQQNAGQLKAMGLKMEVDDIYHPDSTSLKDAVVIFGPGCTGELISSEGLLLTNHHCGYSSIQQHSTVEHNYLQNGFWAMNRNEELPTPGLQVRSIEGIEEVTDFVRQELAKEDSGDEMKAFSPAFLNKLARQKVGADYLEEHPWIEVTIKPFYGGNRYFLFTMNVYNDVRMVGAPPSSIGKFGADTDNWMWPRHTGDFSLFRIYTDKNGNPASYAPDNVPLKPKRYFNISLQGIEKDDFAMIMGFPGTTNRYYTSWEVKQRRDVENAIRIQMRGVKQEEMLAEMLADPKVRIQYASKYAQSSNYWKNSIGMNRGIDKLNVIGQKEQKERLYKIWASRNGGTFLDALDRLKEAIEGENDILAQYYLLSEGLWQGVEFSKVPTNLDGLKKALQQKDAKAIETEIAALRDRYKEFANANYSAQVDKRVSKAMLKAYMQEVAPENRPDIFPVIEKKYKGNTDKFVDEAFAKSIFGSEENFEAFAKKPTVKAIENDPMIQFAVSVKNKIRELIDLRTPYSKAYALANRDYIGGLLRMSGQDSYPDANFTIRLTYGQVLPYSPADGVEYNYYTTYKGILEKEDPDNWEFVVPERLKKLLEAKDFGEYVLPTGELPVCFLTNNDITGGNSGSPVINANGELIGTAFDGNWEAMSGDIVFEPDLQRTISVDIRYILFIIDKYAGARHLIDEMTIVK